MLCYVIRMIYRLSRGGGGATGLTSGDRGGEGAGPLGHFGRNKASNGAFLGTI